MKGLENITPHIPSSDKDETISFLVDILGFSLENHSEYYSELHSGNHVLGVQEPLKENPISRAFTYA